MHPAIGPAQTEEKCFCRENFAENRNDWNAPAAANQRDISTKNFALGSPGDIIGINSDMIVRTEPSNWITDYEPNYLPFIEFYDEDFAWRYTPANGAGDKLRPWIALLVLEDKEFTRSQRRCHYRGSRSRTRLLSRRTTRRDCGRTYSRQESVLRS
jgi:hypothetical protein